MSINYAILGLLSVKPMSGYDLKKVIEASPFMYWSGNNNQIYKAVLKLSDQGYVRNEVRHQEGAPSKKIYTITSDGVSALRKWLLLAPELPELKKPFLVHLAWTGLLNTEELLSLLDLYEENIKGQIAVEQNKREKGIFSPQRTEREAALWSLIYDNIFDEYSFELYWIEQVRAKVQTLADNEPDTLGIMQPDIKDEEKTMKYKVTQKNGTTYIVVKGCGRAIHTEQDALDIVAFCAQNDTNRVLLENEALTDDFLRLGTGLAGAVLQKFITYGIKAAAVLDLNRTQGKFKLFLAESKNNSAFRAYSSCNDAENWLIS